MTHHGFVRSLLAVGGATAVGLLSTAGVASAAGVSLSSSSCPTPQVFITPHSGPVGTSVVVSGTGFSGCAGKNSTAKPTTTLQFAVGFGTGRTHDEVSTSGVTLTNGQTGRAGTFRTSVTVPGFVHGRNGFEMTPAGPAQFGAYARDAATGRVYQADAAFTVLPAGAGGAGSGSGSGSGSASGSGSGSGSGSVPPTSVPTGSAGLATTDPSAAPAELAGLALTGVAGLVLIGAGGRSILRRSRT